MKRETLCLLCLCSCLSLVDGENFFSKLVNRGKSESGKGRDDYMDVCESVKVMPRVALAVVGGAPLKARNSAPYIAALGETLTNGSVSWFCGGSLVSSHHVLTAAHCIVSRNVTTVRVGSFSTRKNPTENDFTVLDTIIHPDYKITQSYNDIAIVRVKDKISFSQNIKPVCLPEDDKQKFEKEKAKVIGWGAEEFGGEGTQKLQQVEVEVFTNEECENAYSNSTIAPKTFPRGIRREQLCAGSSKGGKDACQGDSGGPLVLTDGNGIVRQIGIVSTGAGCGFKKYPGVYVRVSSYKNWIQNQIKAESSTSRNTHQPESSKDKQESKITPNTARKPSHDPARLNYSTTNRPNVPANFANHRHTDVYTSKDGNFQNSNDSSYSNRRTPSNSEQPNPHFSNEKSQHHLTDTDTRYSPRASQTLPSPTG